MDRAKLLFADYCYYRQHTAHIQKLKRERPYLRDLKQTPARLKLFARMAKWCGDQKIEPREWLYTLFVARKWLFCPKLDSAHLQSKKHLPRFQQYHDYTLFRQRQMEQQTVAAASATSTFDPNRDLSHTAELAKRHYLYQNDTRACMDRMQDETFGFHPKSTACARCPAANECREKLEKSVNFDVLALRRGEITAEQAKAEAVCRAQHNAR